MSKSSAIDGFGRAFGAGDFDGDGFDELAINVPSFDSGTQEDVGGAAVLYGALFADGFEGGVAGRWPDVVR